MVHVGVLGGTFDPIHYGHLAAAEGAAHVLGLDRVLFMPNRQPPHKTGRSVTPPEHRSAMVRLAIAGNPRFEYSSLELDREGPSYTIDTVRALQARYPDWRLCFLAGMDSLVELTAWREYRALLQSVEMVFFSRPGYSAAQRDAALEALGTELAARVQVLELPGVAVSGTELRRRATDGYPLRYLVPDAVAQYLTERQLYSNGTE
jgi:nicotinate-nucleotide adenylyltransferase